jgi:GTP diphosphokinase / guanosine-3',5'-bis(diphosphate) 3'-diphosphatase
MQTPYDIALVIRAVEFAAQKHRMQRRKDSDASPYINHPIALMHVLCIDGGITEPAILAAAALHDTIEDTEATEEELRTMFGDEIASLVLEMTDDKSLPKVERKRLQIEHAQHLRREAAPVKTRRQDLQSARCCSEPTGAVESRAEDGIFRVGKGGG